MKVIVDTDVWLKGFRKEGPKSGHVGELLNLPRGSNSDDRNYSEGNTLRDPGREDVPNPEGQVGCILRQTSRFRGIRDCRSVLESLPKQGDPRIKQRFHNLRLFDALEAASLIEGRRFHQLPKDSTDRNGETQEWGNKSEDSTDWAGAHSASF